MKVLLLFPKIDVREKGFLQVVLAIVDASRDRKIDETTLLRELNENFFRILDLTATKSKSKKGNDRDPVLGNVRKLVTEQFVADGYLSKEKNREEGSSIEYRLGGKASYVMKPQDMISFGLNTSKVNIDNQEWNKLVEA